MSLTNPNIGGTDGKFSEVIGYNKPFLLIAGEVVSGVKTKGYGEGDMVILTVSTEDDNTQKRLGIWGSYLVAQIRDADEADFGKVYEIVQGPVDGYSQNPDTKSLVPVS